MNDMPDLDADVIDAARTTLPIFVVADSPDGKVLSNRDGYPDDDTPVWLEGRGGPAEAVPMGDLYAEYGNDLVAYAEPEKVGDAVAAAMAEEPKRTADGEVVINPDAPPDPKLQLPEATRKLLDSAAKKRAAAEAKGDTAKVEALDRYTEALLAGKSDAEAYDIGWPKTAPAAAPEAKPGVTAAIVSGADAIAEFREALIADGLDAETADRLIANGTLAIPQDGVTAAVCAPGDIIRPGDNPADVLGDPHKALDRLEAFLSDAEDRLGITAALNGPGIIPRPTVRKAVGGNPDAQAEVVQAFEANYRDDLTEFIEDVLGPRPDPDTPEHDQEAWDDLAAEARLWHARRMGVAASLRQSARNTTPA